MNGVWRFGEVILTEDNISVRGKQAVSVPLLSPQVPYEIAQD